MIGAKKARIRVLNDDELRALWRAMRPGLSLWAVVSIARAYGSTQVEVAEARWSEFDLG